MDEVSVIETMLDATRYITKLKAELAEARAQIADMSKSYESVCASLKSTVETEALWRAHLAEARAQIEAKAELLQEWDGRLLEARAQIAKLKDQIKMQDIELQRLFKRLQKARRLGPLIGSGETE